MKHFLYTAEHGGKITYADTPFEIWDKGGNDGAERLFELYTEVRYGDSFTVSNADAELCKTIVESLGK